MKLSKVIAPEAMAFFLYLLSFRILHKSLH